jgi:two-component system sensor histidine kinase KdpD
VLVNLLDNALKYSFPDSPIQISACVVGAALQIQVADCGIGIPREDLTRVFDKFFSVQRPRKAHRLVPVDARSAKFDRVFRVHRPDKTGGIGLGLSICKGIVEAHGGTIDAANRDGGGTLITLNLPLPEEQIR